MKKITAKEQLEIIQGLCIACNDGFYKTKEEITGAYMMLSENVYMVAHLNGTCKNPHLDWHKETRELQKKLIKNGIIGKEQR